MKKNKNSYEVLEAEVAKLKEENRHLKDERDELKYMHCMAMEEKAVGFIRVF